MSIQSIGKFKNRKFLITKNSPITDKNHYDEEEVVLEVSEEDYWINFFCQIIEN